MRTRLASSCSALLIALAAAACTESLPIPPGDGAAQADAAIDVPQPDLAPPPVADFAVAPLPDLTALPDLAVRSIGVGKACPNGNECGAGFVCLDENASPTLPPGGYCTKACKDDADCGDDAFCGPPIPGIGNICWKLCGPGDACLANQVCSRRLNGYIDLVRKACIPGDATARDGDRCKGFYQCNKNQSCNANPFEAPGGGCFTFGCTPGDDSTCAAGGDGACIQGPGFTVCLDRCAQTADCRAVEGYECVALPDGKMTKVCQMVHRGAGDPCQSDLQCGPAGTPWRCLMGPRFPGGYCAGPPGGCRLDADLTCPDNAFCLDPTPGQVGSGDETCARRCTADAQCRLNEGYRCLPIDPRDPINGAKGCRLP